VKGKAVDYFVPRVTYQVFRKCRPDWQVLPRVLDENEITYVIEGKARYTIDGKAYELEAGDLLCLTEGMEKKAVTYPDNLMHCFSVNYIPLHFSSEAKLPPLPIVSHIGIRKDLIDLFHELTISWTGHRQNYMMKAGAQLMLIIHRLLEILVYNIDTEPGDYRINKAIRIIALNYASKITVKNLANQVHLNKFYFGRLFKQKMGMTANQYIIQVRVRNAESMLQTGNYKVQDVAEHCGFSDVIHFYKSFMALRGFPPSKCIPRDKGRHYTSPPPPAGTASRS
jgi:AraC-like DNA-binding protein